MTKTLVGLNTMVTVMLLLIAGCSPNAWVIVTIIASVTFITMLNAILVLSYECPPLSREDPK